MRMLVKNPGFTAVAVLTLTLGIGANTELFSVVNGVLLNPLVFPEPNQLVALYANRVQFERASISYPNFLDWQRENKTFVSMAAFRSDDFNLTGAGEAEHIRGEMVSADFFSTLGVKPMIGSSFTSEEDHLGGAPVVVISAGLWTRKFGSAPDIVGKRIALNDTDYTIVGVVPAGFRLRMQSFQENNEVYIPSIHLQTTLARRRRLWQCRERAVRGWTRGKWRARRDSNSRPSGSKPSKEVVAKNLTLFVWFRIRKKRSRSSSC
jgi:hypothetical protein